MPIVRLFSADRLEIRDDVTKSCIKDVIDDPKVKVIQAIDPISAKSWKLINDFLIPKRPDIQIRIFGHYSTVCDLSLLSQIPAVENLAVDCLRQARNIDYISELHALKSLSVGIYEMDNFDFLASLPPSLDNLYLGATKSKKPKLDGLSHLSNLRQLSVEGHQKNLEVIGELRMLEKLTLRSVSPKDISFIRALKRLWFLDIKLGGINDLSAIHGLENLKYLELWQIKGLSDVSVISSLKGLQFLFLQSLRNVTVFPDLSRLTQLRRVYLETMKGLEDLAGLFKAPALEEYVHLCAQNMTPEQYQKLLEIKSLKKALIRFGSDKKNNQMDALMHNHGIEQFAHESFVFE
jgi:hypothetical protein